MLADRGTGEPTEQPGVTSAEPQPPPSEAMDVDRLQQPEVASDDRVLPLPSEETEVTSADEPPPPSVSDVSMDAQARDNQHAAPEDASAQAAPSEEDLQRQAIEIRLNHGDNDELPICEHCHDIMVHPQTKEK